MLVALPSVMSVRSYAHLTWTTLGRQPLIDAPVAAFLHRMLPILAARHGTRIVEIGVINDHLHLILQLPARVDIPRLVQGLKGASARIANREGVALKARPLRWASGYDWRSVSVTNLERAVEYVRNQPQRHPDRAVSAQ
jgi:REP element-mobilizing transposase RayT